VHVTLVMTRLQCVEGVVTWILVTCPLIAAPLEALQAAKRAIPAPVPLGERWNLNFLFKV
jgi:hypothetical protein